MSRANKPDTQFAKNHRPADRPARGCRLCGPGMARRSRSSRGTRCQPDSVSWAELCVPRKSSTRSAMWFILVSPERVGARPLVVDALVRLANSSGRSNLAISTGATGPCQWSKHCNGCTWYSQRFNGQPTGMGIQSIILHQGAQVSPDCLHSWDRKPIQKQNKDIKFTFKSWPSTTSPLTPTWLYRATFLPGQVWKASPVCCLMNGKLILMQSLSQ